MQPGDKLVIYHTGDERPAVGHASVVSVSVNDTKTPWCGSKRESGPPRPHISRNQTAKALAELGSREQGRLWSCLTES